MYGEIYDWLCLRNELKIPGIGIIRLQRQAASLDFRNRQILPPSYFFSFESKDQSQPPSRNFFNWLSAVLNISDREAIIRFNDFVFDLRKELAEGNTIDWKGVGVLNRRSNGEINFAAEQYSKIYLQSVQAEKIVRENASHIMRVGERERTTAEMTDLLNLPVKKRVSWRLIAMVTGLMAIILIIWHFAVNGFDPTSTGNTQKLRVAPQVASYRFLP